MTDAQQDAERIIEAIDASILPCPCDCDCGEVTECGDLCIACEHGQHTEDEQ